MSKFMILFYDKDGPTATFDRQTETDNFAAWMQNMVNVDDRGAPFTLNAKTVSQSSINEGIRTENSPNGYCIIEAKDIDIATESIKECPVIANGGNVEVREIFSV